MKFMSFPGLPDGLFSNQKSQFGQILEGLKWENADILYGHLEYFKDIWDVTEKSEAIACARRCRSSRLTRWWIQKKIIGKNGRRRGTSGR
jgi:hypothetical protein